MSLPAGARLGPYEILGPLGAGGMGEVYRARDTRLNRDVALKILPPIFAADPDRMARFEREAQLLASLNHSHIAALHGLEESGSTRALVMELVEGPTLADRIAAGPIPIEEALGIAKQIAEALEYAHDCSVIHRDLKPANVKVTPHGAVKVLDFGLAKGLDDQQISIDPRNSPTLTMGSPATRLGVVLGTASYMSPEQAKGKPVDRRCDVWAFGVVLFEMLTGKLLFEGETPAETMASVMKEAPALDRLPSGTPAAVRNLIQRCLEKDSRRRLQHIGEARIAIDDVLSGVVREEAPVPPRPASRFRFVPWAVAGLLFVSLAALAFMHFRETPAQQASARFEVPPPGESRFPMFKLSPDGRYLAIVAAEGDQTRLWVRPLDSIEARALPGADGATSPFWSPDSGFLAFFAQGKLKKIALAGGPPQTLCDAPAGRGGTWNSDGVIVFAPELTGGLYRVSAAGGIRTPVTKPEGTNGHRLPEFLPGGGRFTYVAFSDKPEAAGIYVGSLDGTPPARVLPDLSPAVFAVPVPPSVAGHLVFRREDTLMAQPFDPSGLRTTGDIFPLAEEIGVAGFAGSAAFSVSGNGVLAFRAGGLGSRELVWVDRTGKRLDVITKPAAFSSAALSPDEKRIALDVRRRGVSNIWLQDLTRGAMSQLTLRPGYNRAAVWSPDGSRLVFVASPASPIFDLYQTSAGGGKEELLVHAGVNATPYDWSTDGKFLVYSQYGEKTNDDLWLLPLDGDRKPIPYLQGPSNEVLGSFSPNGRWMAYVSDESGPQQVYVQPIPPRGDRLQVSTAGGTQPRWRHDGKELFYVASDQKLMAVPVKSGWAASGPFEVGAPQTLFPGMLPDSIGRSRAFLYQPAADGQRFMVIARSGREAATPPPITVVTNWQAALKK